MATPLPPKRPGLSLYADLLEPAGGERSGTTIAGAPVKYDVTNAEAEVDAATAQRKKDALRFQPIKRPQVQPKRSGKPVTSSSSAHKLSSGPATAPASSPDKPASLSTPQQPPDFQRSNFDDWVADDDDDFGYQGRQRQQRKKKKKKQGPETRSWDWDDIYDPSLPNVYADYKGSEEQVREIRDWKARLYYHQLAEANTKRPERSNSQSSDGAERPRPPSSSSPAPDYRSAPTDAVPEMFAPPASLTFAPPSFESAAPNHAMEDADDDDDYYPPALPSEPREGPLRPPPSFAPSSDVKVQSGENASEKRPPVDSVDVTRSSPPPPPPRPLAETAPIQTQQSWPPRAPELPTPIPASHSTLDSGAAGANSAAAAADIAIKRAEAQAKIAAFKAKLGKPPSISTVTPPIASHPTDAVAETRMSPTQPAESQPPPPPPPPSVEPTGIISRAAVRYDVAPPQSDALADSEDGVSSATATDVPDTEQPRSSRPGQKGFAERLLMKYGWEKGQGLGAQGEGITTAIIAKADKRKKRADADGGGFSTPANMGKIVGGKRRKVAADETDSGDGAGASDARYGAPSNVIKLDALLAGLDVAREIEDHNVLQRLGDRLGGQYGNIERLFVWREDDGGRNDVFVQFTSTLSALRAVNAADGMDFAGRNVRAHFFDADRFESGDYA